jgi:hypothetical protein
MERDLTRGLSRALSRGLASSFGPSDALGIFGSALWGWYDLTQETGYSTDDPLDYLLDFSGNERTISVIAGEVTYASDGLGGASYPTAYLRTARAASSVIALVQPLSLFLVAKTPTAGVAGNETMIDGTTGNTMRFFTSNATDYALYGGSQITATGDYTSSKALFEIRFNGASSYLKINGVTHVTGNAGAASPNGVNLGSYGGISTAHGDLDLGELIVVSGTPTADQIAAISDVLNDKWGM